MKKKFILAEVLCASMLFTGCGSTLDVTRFEPEVIEEETEEPIILREETEVETEVVVESHVLNPSLHYYDSNLDLSTLEAISYLGLAEGFSKDKAKQIGDVVVPNNNNSWYLEGFETSDWAEDIVTEELTVESSQVADSTGSGDLDPFAEVVSNVDLGATTNGNSLQFGMQDSIVSHISFMNAPKYWLNIDKNENNWTIAEGSYEGVFKDMKCEAGTKYKYDYTNSQWSSDSSNIDFSSIINMPINKDTFTCVGGNSNGDLLYIATSEGISQIFNEEFPESIDKLNAWLVINSSNQVVRYVEYCTILEDKSSVGRLKDYSITYASVNETNSSNSSGLGGL